MVFVQPKSFFLAINSDLPSAEQLPTGLPIFTMFKTNNDLFNGRFFPPAPHWSGTLTKQTADRITKIPEWTGGGVPQ